MQIPSLFDLIIWHRGQKVSIKPKNIMGKIVLGTVKPYETLKLDAIWKIYRLEGIVPTDILWRADKVYESNFICPGCECRRSGYWHGRCRKCRIVLCGICMKAHTSIG